MATWLILLIVGIVLLIVAYYISGPPPVKTLANIGGWVCVAVGLILLLVGVTGLGRA